MRKMGFETMRSGHSKYSNILIGVTIVCIFLVYNCWSLSTQNYELLKQMDDMGEQLRVCSEEKSLCANKKNGVDSQLRNTEARVAEMKMAEMKSSDTLRRLKSEVNDLTKTVEKARQELHLCQPELESLKKLDASKTAMIDTLKIEKETVAAQLSEARDKVRQLDATVKSLKQTTAASISRAADAVLLKYTASPIPKPKGNEDSEKVQEINNEPVQGGNHEIDESLADNAANEDMDDAQESPKRA